ncbi:hypothetical protein SAMN05421833_13347 [Microbispora rosea]|uniref:Uncharacterized protein n=1 Tax=Microbispora rosea TaxID=58117 RepID=A0A1N7GVZ0_9ACTN|nr:hypothetical protein SAMN05421833_13347 [Microbispora rosea]
MSSFRESPEGVVQRSKYDAAGTVKSPGRATRRIAVHRNARVLVGRETC